MSAEPPVELEHHKQQDLCVTRPAYRQGRKLTAVKAYTVNSESVYLLIFGVPRINLRSEIKTLCQKYGTILLVVACQDYPTEDFTECFKVRYDRIQSARVAKKLIDTKNFYGGVLHVCYAPELENVDDTREKLKRRRFEIIKRLKNHEKSLTKDGKNRTEHKTYENTVNTYSNTNNIDYDNRNLSESMIKINSTSVANLNCSYNGSLENIGDVQCNFNNPYSSLQHFNSNNLKFDNATTSTLNCFERNANVDQCNGYNSKIQSGFSLNPSSSSVNSNVSCYPYINTFLHEGEVNRSNGTEFSTLVSDKSDSSVQRQFYNNVIVDHQDTTSCTKEKLDSLPSTSAIESGATRKVEEKVYVFKRTRKRKTNSLANMVKELEKRKKAILSEVSKKKSESHVNVVGAEGRVVVCENIEKPRIVKVPPKAVNKIVFNINKYNL